jgi:hypothetical protein
LFHVKLGRSTIFRTGRLLGALAALMSAGWPQLPVARAGRFGCHSTLADIIRILPHVGGLLHRDVG